MQKFIITTVLLFVTVLGLGGWAFYLQQELKTSANDNDILEDRNSALKKLNDKGRNKYKNYRAKKEDEISNLESERDQSASDLKKLLGNEKLLKEKDDLLKEKQKKLDDQEKKFVVLQESRKQLQKELDQQQKDYKTVVNQLKDNKTAMKKVEKKAGRYEKENEDLKQELEQSRELCDGFKKKVQNLEKMIPEKSAEPIKGKVKKTASSPDVDDNCIIISGLSGKPASGTIFSVFQENEYIGRAEVYRSFESMAGARISFLVEGKTIQAGDVVLTGFPAPDVMNSPEKK